MNNQIDKAEYEKEVQILEDRARTAQNDFIVACDNKKRVLGEIETLNNIIDDKKLIIENINLDIKECKQTLGELHLELTNTQEELDNLIIVKNNEIEQLQDEYNNLSKQIIVKNKELQNNTQNAQQSLIAILKELDTLTEKKRLALSEYQDVLSKITTLKTEVDDLCNIKSKRYKEIIMLDKALNDKTIILNETNQVINDKQHELSLIKDKIKNMELHIKSCADDLAKLEKEITKKEEEYKSIESRAFVILQKNDILEKKESFIRMQYERAGIRWEE